MICVTDSPRSVVALPAILSLLCFQYEIYSGSKFERRVLKVGCLCIEESDESHTGDGNCLRCIGVNCFSLYHGYIKQSPSPMCVWLLSVPLRIFWRPLVTMVTKASIPCLNGTSFGVFVVSRMCYIALQDMDIVVVWVTASENILFKQSSSPTYLTGNEMAEAGQECG